MSRRIKKLISQVLLEQKRVKISVSGEPFLCVEHQGKNYHLNWYKNKKKSVDIPHRGKSYTKCIEKCRQPVEN